MTAAPAAPSAAPAQRRRTSGPRVRRTLLAAAAALAVLAVGALAVALVLGGGAYAASPEGLPDPGPLVGWGVPLTRLATDAAGVLTVGWLLAAAFLDPQGRQGTVSRTGRQDLVRAVWAAASWCVLALVQAWLTLAQVLGVPAGEALNPDLVSTYAWEIPTTRALVVVALLAAVVAVGAALTAQVGPAAAWLVLAVLAATLPALAGHSSALGDHALATSAGVAHVAAAVLWVGGLAALAVHAVRGDPGLRAAATRFGPLAIVAVLLLGASGLANAYTRLEGPTDLVTTGYGLVVLAKIVLLFGLVAIGAVMRRRLLPRLDGPGGRRAFAQLAAVESAVMVTAVALGVALSVSPPVRVEAVLPSLGETLLGFPYPPAPDGWRVLLGFRLEPLFLVGSLVALGGYLWAVVRLHRRGDRWPWGRTISWIGGITLIIWATNAGIAVYAQVSVGMHMLQHMSMTMLAPILLVLGAPATLALRALPASHTGERGPREWLVWGLHSWLARLLTNPFYVFFVYVLGLFGLYLTPLFGWLMGSHVGHIVMQLHFLASGYLFYWVVIGIDPRPRPLPYWGRLLLLLIALGVHGFFAVVLMMLNAPLAQEWYGVVRPPWVTDPVADTWFGGQIAWGISEIPTLIVLVALTWQWARADDKEARRRDRQADRDGDADLRAYNARLARLAERDARDAAADR